MSVLAAKQAQLTAKLDEAEALQKGFTDDPSTHTPENQEKFNGIVEAVKTLQSEIKTVKDLEAARETANEDIPERKAFEPAQVSERFTQAPTLGEQLINSEAYKAAVKVGGATRSHIEVEAKGMLHPGSKATFTSILTGADTTVNYLPGIVDIRQERLTIRDLLAVGQTTQAAITYLKETSFTNAATTVAEEGLKPEASFQTEAVVAPVKKIAVIGRVTDEMFADYPQMRDYVNNRLRFMVQAREEAQLYAGNGVGANITGITATSGIQTQAKGTDSNFVAIHKAITKVRTVGFAEPDGIVLHPTDWQLLRLATDANTQFYGGGPFSEQYGNGPFRVNPAIWGLTPVVTTAATAGTALVGAFRESAMIFQREGITVATTDTDASDFSYNRIAIRVEERLALAVFRPLGFCTVTGIA